MNSFLNSVFHGATFLGTLRMLAEELLHGQKIRRLGVRPALLSSSPRGNTEMGNLSGVVQQLKRERERAQQEVQRIDGALAALGNLSSYGSSRQRTMSAAARRRISLAQKARWAKQKARPKRTISAAGRRRIAAAQRARWARVKKNKAA